jgi:hypothetical protein
MSSKRKTPISGGDIIKSLQVFFVLYLQPVGLALPLRLRYCLRVSLNRLK